MKWFSSWTLKRKRRMLRGYDNVSVIAPSEWLGRCARESTLLSRRIPVTVIPNLLNTEIFKLIDRGEARRLMNLPLEKKLICFGAVGGNASPYKGWSYLVEALRHLTCDGVDLVLFGGFLSDADKKELIFPMHEMGFLHDQYSMMLLYNACDVFVMPSLAENYPQTVMESISCGTPVVGFDVGGIPDLVEHHQTGYLAKYKDTDDLAAGINWVLQDTTITRESLHQFAEQNFSEEVVVERHRQLWNLDSVNG